MPSSSSQSDDPSLTSTSLIVRIQLRDEVAWARLVDLYSPLIWGWCRGSGLQPNDADDVLQDVFASVSRSISGYQRNGPFRRWLWQITRNKMLDHYRARKKTPLATGGTDFGNWLAQVPEAPPEDATVSDVRNSLIWRALEMIRVEFEESTWNAFTRMVFDKRTAAETAVELGWANENDADLNRGAKRVRQAKFRVMKRLRDEFGDILDVL